MKLSVKYALPFVPCAPVRYQYAPERLAAPSLPAPLRQPGMVRSVKSTIELLKGA